MAKPKPHAETIFKWLRDNLGHRCLAPLTGTDSRCLMAAVQIMEAYAYDRVPGLLEAFRLVVIRMQPQCREFAFHAIAHVMEWSDRDILWDEAGLDPLESRMICAYEPQGQARAVGEQT